MADFFFLVFACLTVVSAMLMVFSRNAVNAAMFLLLSCVGVAALFVQLEAYFLAVLQVLVYVGAVVVLFLFIIMLLDVKVEAEKHFRKLSVAAAVAAGALLVVGVFATLDRAQLQHPTAAAVSVPGADLKNYGAQLFTTYLLPLQVTGFLLLIAMVGVIVLSRKYDETPEVTSRATGVKP